MEIRERLWNLRHGHTIDRRLSIENRWNHRGLIAFRVLIAIAATVSTVKSL